MMNLFQQATSEIDRPAFLPSHQLGTLICFSIGFPLRDAKLLGDDGLVARDDSSLQAEDTGGCGRGGTAGLGLVGVDVDDENRSQEIGFWEVGGPAAAWGIVDGTRERRERHEYVVLWLWLWWPSE